MKRHFIVHDVSDNVGVAMCDIAAGEAINGVLLAGGMTYRLIATESIPFGHKLAISNIENCEELLRYGSCIGIATATILKGCHVHIHNVQSNRCRS